MRDPWKDIVRARLAPLRLSPAREAEIVEELSQHLDDRWRELVSGGASHEAATRLTMAQFQSEDALARYIAPLHQARTPAAMTPGTPGTRWLADLAHDIRFAARMLWKQPGFAAVAIVTLALGIGAASAIFSVVHGVLLKPLPFPDPDRLAVLYHVTPASPRDFSGAAEYLMYREQGRVFEDVALWNSSSVSVTRNATPAQITAVRVTDGLLPLLGVRPALGRLISKQDDTPGAPLRVLLTHAYWQREFGASYDVLGQPLVVNARPHEIIGVLPASFTLLHAKPDVVLPIRINPATTRTGALFFDGLVRLKPGVTIAEANADIGRMLPMVTQRYPLFPGITQEMWTGAGLAPNVVPLTEVVIGDMARPLWILLGTVGVVLLMAWANVANLLLVRAEARQRELAVRTALGASGGRIARALVSETLVLGIAGGALGVLAAQGGIALLRRIAPVALPRVDEIAIDGTVVFATIATSILTSLVFGLIPALKVRRLNAGALSAAGRSSTETPGQHRTRHALVVAQVALALVLLVVSGLMARTFVAMRAVDRGYQTPTALQTFDVSLPPAAVREDAEVARTHERLAARMQQIPGVHSAGLVGSIDFGAAGKAPVYVQGQDAPGLPPTRWIKTIGPGYFETTGNAVVAGRTFTWNDMFHPTPIALISENLAREHWRSPAEAVGRRLRMFVDEPWAEIIGVVGDVRADGLNQPPPPIVYLPMVDAQGPSRGMTYVVRSTRAGTDSLMRELKAAVWSIAPNVPLGNPRTMAEIESASTASTTFAMIMLGIAAVSALALGIIGLYGVVRYIVAQRTREIGIRMALGAQATSVRWLFLRHGLVLTSVGIALGLGAAVLTTRVMTALLFGVTPTDPITYVGASLGLATTAALAAYLPARRASTVNPIAALRSDA